MEPQPTPEPPTLESVFEFLHTNEWKVLVKVFEYYVRDANKTNIRKAAPYWTTQRKRDAEGTHYAWEQVIAKLDSIRQAMSDLPEHIASQSHYSIRTKCDSISETIVTIVYDFAAMHADFTRYLYDKNYDTVKMKYFRQGPNGLWGGVHVKCGKLFGGVQNLRLLSFLHRIYDVFLLGPDPDPDGYFNRYPRRRCTWPDYAAIPANFRYRGPEGLLIVNPDGSHMTATPSAPSLQGDYTLEEHGMQSDSSGDERDERDDSDDDVVSSSMRTIRIGPDSDEDVDLEAPMFGGRGSDSQGAHLTTMLHALKQLSVS
jgi:hypothetical protein